MTDPAAPTTPEGVLCACSCGCRRLMFFEDGHRSGTERCDSCWHGHYSEGDFVHRDEPGCFCRPRKTYTDPVTNTEVWVHRYAND